MECRSLEITVISAKDLKDVNLFTKMDVYAVVSINGDHRTAQRTPIDKDCGSNPKWNYSMKFTIEEALAQQNRLNLNFRLKSDRQLGDKEIGDVAIPIKELLDHNNGNGKGEQNVSYNVRLPNGKPKGVLNFSYKFGEKFEKAVPQPPQAAAAMAYPPPPTGYPGPSTGHPPPSGAYPPPPKGAAAAAYPPPPQGAAATAYPYPPPPGAYPPPPYGYPPQGPAPGYGYPGYPPQGGYGYNNTPVMQKPQKPKRGGMGAGMGLGLAAAAAGGLLGGMLIGDMVGDVVEDAFDPGFDSFDCGFDF
ncbi:C2 calcium-dependent membrane targeting [Corchorus olitorius]|uniref:C2 calcium-dependent membrane targeting n=1 Tax=Corchorus olitorius TaxID=93759 RepID=A0A1R3K8A1_9ROSI|nr:C2 calcium-dependent membrane targeting [Corchorus olitorius]